MASLATKFTFFDMFLDDSINSLNSDDDEIIFCMFEKEKRISVTGYAESVVPSYSLDEFHTHFRLQMSSYEILLQMIMSESPLTPEQQHGRPAVPAQKQALVGLWFLATSECCRALSDRFDLSKSTIKRITRRFTGALHDLKRQLIVWPVGGKIIETTEKFKAIVGFPGVIGSVDGTHIMIPKPSDHSGAYLNRKKSYSIVLQGVCDADLCFTDVHVGWPGSVHDARVYQNSPLATMMQNMPDEYHLLGDGAYPLSGDFGNLTQDGKTYNWKNAATRTTVERAFGLLKGKWRRLKMAELSVMQDLCLCVMAACVLHNFIISAENINGDSDVDDSGNDDNDASADNSATSVGCQKRDLIKNLIK